MKLINRYIVKGIACLMTGFLGACSNNGSEELSTLVERVEISRATEIKAEIKDLSEGGLDAALEAAVGAADKYNVTNLTLSGKINGADVVTLHKLLSLVTLDVQNLKWEYKDDGSSHYEISVRIWDGDISTCSGSLYANGISSFMFAGFNSLKSIVLPNSGIESIDYLAFGGCMALESIQLPASVTRLNHESLARIGVKTLTIPATVTEIDYDFCRYDENLQAIFWESTANVPQCNDIQNVFLYVSDVNTIVSSEWKNVIINGVAESIEIRAKERWQDDYSAFVAPRAFTAKKMTYTRYFDLGTGFGYSSGWETIVLPFVPISFTHETKGVIAPFNSGIADAKAFWLRSLTANGFVDVTSMEANVPYIISMPNNDSYFEEYRLNGWVTFTGENVTIPESVSQPTAVQGPEFSLQPTYEPVKQSNSIYSLNVRDGGGYNQGSTFMRGGGDVRAFEAYAVVGGRSIRSLIDVDCSSSNTTRSNQKNTSGIPQIGDM